MPDPRVVEAVAGLCEDLPARLLFSVLAENLAEVCAILGRLGYKDLPPEFLTQLRAIEAEMQEIGRLCCFPPQPARKRRGQEVSLPLF
ncbi:MAG: hypothetical protein ACP5LJ_02755 [Candidatus Bipolaricaulaceae bacterium]